MKLLISTAIILLSYCSARNVDREKTEYVIQNGESPVQILIIDSCEYLYGPWGSGAVLTHKGNCKYCKRR